MPRGKGTQPPDALKPSQYPAWFAEWSEAQESDEGAVKWLREYEGDDLKSLLCGILSSGGAMFITRTRDGGALSFTVMFGDAKKKWYITSAEELDVLVSRVAT
jgi:hypothetical protein